VDPYTREVMMNRFVALYEGPTVSSARLLALSADERVVAKFYEALAPEPEPKAGSSREPQPLAVVRGEED
jgi:hypothetical protein